MNPDEQPIIRLDASTVESGPLLRLLRMADAPWYKRLWWRLRGYAVPKRVRLEHPFEWHE